ncbi:NlpC/P60 family protein [Fodinibius roseus]|uniref:NlpC/P60 family protein n=1 Tax=Fodinibius roseus TaxID=1194090 RepID=A0A1M5A051_9BACT|nr:NlpC/P60 family protein [Fodinibius roseus]SHF23645.1 NlpC/P60 family protein [Fodinibius roseus]
MEIRCVVNGCALLLIIFLSFQACSSAGTVRHPSNGSEHEVTDPARIERRDSLLVEKYASMLDTDRSLIEQSFTLYQFIEQQLNTPCSDTPGEQETSYGELTQKIFNRVYDRKIPATYEDLRTSPLIPKFSARSYLAEGDLIFFEEEEADQLSGEHPQPAQPAGKTVGVYLQNNRFLICSEEAGAVVVNNLDSRYWSRRYKMAGRLR